MRASRRALLATAIVALSLPATRAQDAPGPAPARPAGGGPTELGFLQVGRSYLIKFPEQNHPVLVRETETVGPPTTTDAKTGEVRPIGSQPVTWNMKFQINVFVVRELGGGPWALLEHPADPRAAFQIMAARHVLADPKRVAEMEKTDFGRPALVRLRADAASTLETTRTWINLNHATSIADPPKEGPDDWTFKVNVTMKPSDPRPATTPNR